MGQLEPMHSSDVPFCLTSKDSDSRARKDSDSDSDSDAEVVEKPKQADTALVQFLPGICLGRTFLQPSLTRNDLNGPA
jgi:hypothetical protein